MYINIYIVMYCLIRMYLLRININKYFELLFLLKS